MASAPPDEAGPIARATAFLRHGLWQGDLRAMPPGRRIGLGALRVAVHLARSFSHTIGGLQAAGLTLVTLLSLVPVLALVLAIARAFGYGKRLEENLIELAHEWPSDLQGAVESIRSMVEAVNFGALGLIGLLVALWSGLMLFGRVELAFNHIWRTRRSRSWYRRLTDFVALVVLVPPLVVAALVVSSLLGGASVVDALRDYPVLGWLHHAGLGFLPHVLLWVAFAALYKIMPSAPVRWSSALVGAVLAGSATIFLNDIYVRFQIGVANANALYGTLAALPLLLIYLQLGWTLVLAGAEISYAVQNLGTLRGAEELPQPGTMLRQRLAWHLVDQVCAGFRSGRHGATAADVGRRLDVPGEWMAEIADALVQRGVLVAADAAEDLLMPAKPPEQIDLREVVAALEPPLGDFLERARLPAPAEATVEAARTAAGQQLAGIGFGR